MATRITVEVVIFSRWSYKGKTYMVSGLPHVKWTDGEWRPAVLYVPEERVAGAPNYYVRLRDEFVTLFERMPINAR